MPGARARSPAPAGASKRLSDGNRAWLAASSVAKLGRKAEDDPYATKHCIETSLLIIGVYGGALFLAHALLPLCFPDATDDYWGNSGQPFDAPEPNYHIVPWIAEFWSVVTVFPFAGVNLLRFALKYDYAPILKAMYILNISMYSCALVSHTTLYTLVNQVTCAQVISAAIYAYMAWGWIVGWPLQVTWLRVTVGLCGWLCCLGGIAVFPWVLTPVGGVYTLFVVQTPPVLGAFLGAMAVKYNHRLQARKPEAMRVGENVLVFAGFLLTSAMALSLVEVYYGASHGVLHSAAGFPWMHIVIHTFEQVGIYLSGFGSACLHHVIADKSRDAKVQYALGFIPYLRLDGPEEKEAEEAETETALRSPRYDRTKTRTTTSPAPARMRTRSPAPRQKSR
jgi:hypothetical protein